MYSIQVQLWWWTARAPARVPARVARFRRVHRVHVSRRPIALRRLTVSITHAAPARQLTEPYTLETVVTALVRFIATLCFKFKVDWNFVQTLLAWRHFAEIYLGLTTLRIIHCAQRHYVEWCNKVGRQRAPLLWRWKRFWGFEVLSSIYQGVRGPQAPRYEGVPTWSCWGEAPSSFP